MLRCILLILFLPGLLHAEPDENPKEIKPEALRAQARQLAVDGKLDEAIVAYAKLFANQSPESDVITEARDTTEWMRLLWKRNQPGTEEEMGDRKAAVQAGDNLFFLRWRRIENLPDGADLTAWKLFVAQLETYKTELEWEEKFNKYIGIIETTKDAEEREQAMIDLIFLFIQNGEFDKAIQWCQRFLKDGLGQDAFSNNWVRYYLAWCHEQEGNVDNAIGLYARLWATHMGTISISAPAMEGWMRILWKRNKPEDENVLGDRDGAAQGGRKYIEQTEKFQDQMQEKDLKAWLRVREMVETYEAELKKQGAAEEK